MPGPPAGPSYRTTTTSPAVTRAARIASTASSWDSTTTAGPEKVSESAATPAVVVESQEEAVEAILAGRVTAGDVVVVRYEGPAGGPGMQEMLYPTTYIKARGLGAVCALITDGRFSGGTSGLSIGHVSPEAAAGGVIALVADGDVIDIDIPGRVIHLRVDDAELAARRAAVESAGGYRPRDRDRAVSPALRAYAAMATSADKGGGAAAGRRGRR